MSQDNLQELELSWSDGDSKFWPPTEGSSKSQECHIQTAPGDDVSIQWRLKLGAGLAKHLQPSHDGVTYILKDWPEGYMLFIHCKGNRRDKYLYGRKNVRYRSAAEFMPHALWLWAKSNATDPPPSCQCRHCLPDRRAVRGKELLSQKSRKPVKPTVLRLPPNRRSPIKFSSTTLSHSSNGTTDGSQHHTTRPSITDNQSIFACVRVAAQIATPSVDGNARSANTQPILYELVWCKLWRSIACAEVLIDFWPGIIKEDINGSDEYVVTLIGISHDMSISLNAMVPYRAYRIEETLIRGIKRCCRGGTRVRLLNLNRHLGTELDDNRFAAVSSVFLFAVTFSEHLATVWSWSSKLDNADCGSVAAAPSQSRYALRSQKSKEEQHNTLWWGPECIKIRQLVQLKISRDVISMGEDVSAPGSVGSKGPVFLQIHTMSYLPKSQRTRRSLAGPVVAGMVFELTDEHQYDRGSDQDLPPPPRGKVFRPLLKEGYEIVLPITVLSGRYHCEIDPSSTLNDNSTPGVHSKSSVGTGCVKHLSIIPTTFCATRAKMVEHAYESGRAQTLRMMTQ